ncbi:helix-turn-helix transcriptional regulator [Cohnella sp. GCM10020058]|uniref:helix-turn-helix transcriptional regulator n=1 Tax=Cohnella sp. GCM10020058 TaxID=3317330 RepID=UPI00362FC5ED
MENLNEALVEARKGLQLTISNAAREIGISYGMLAMMESSKRKGSDSTKIKVSKFYGRSVQELFYND